MNVDKIEKISSNKNIFYAIKNKIKNIINHNKASKYLYLFILGDNRYVDSDIKNNYQNLGISHLFSISGMHISILSGIILLLLKKIHISENKRYLLTCLFISFYIFLVNFCPSALRSGIFFILLSINTIFYFNIKPINLLLLTTSIILFFNPYIIYNVGFLFSVVITASLILFSNLLNRHNNYIYKTLMTSLIAFLFSLPISLYNYYQVNILTIFYNLLFVPLVSIIIFPLSLLSFIIPLFSNVLIFLTSILERLTSFLSLIDSNIIFNKPSLFIVFIYYLVITIIFKYHKKISILLFLLMLLIHYNYNVLFPKDYMLMIDVGQGDSILLHSSKYDALIDTGGKLQNSNISKTTLIPLFKSLGIRKIDYLFLTHGDYDHLGEAINLINNFNIKTVYFNEGNVNYNEKKIITLLKEKNIDYSFSKKGNKYKIGSFSITSLNSDLKDENDSSLILYGTINKNNFLLMGDASKKSEKVLFDNYNLPEISILKVGHHGSNTSTSSNLLETIRPKYALISAGQNNKFGHPHQETLDNLNKFSIRTYVTSRDGAILVNFAKRVTFSHFGT